MKPTDKVIMKINSGASTKTEVADKLGISRPTLDKRIIDNSWKKGELKLIELL
jgi:DNA invertase Pin-like site-specific DNA recombinase